MKKILSAILMTAFATALSFSAVAGKHEEKHESKAKHAEGKHGKSKHEEGKHGQSAEHKATPAIPATPATPAKK